ncbi:MAG: DNA polymerase III subunit beta [Pseudanabaenaceae cyanobacterium bins.68]|nr:DNA polymerase III subunit beta [Pseudanabaenaceae cyanobacterium bins.68]
MKFVCAQNQLTTALSQVKNAVASRPNHVILANVLFVADAARQMLHLTAFDLNLAIEVSLTVEVLEPGLITIPARLLGDIVTKLPNQDVTVQVIEGENIVAIACGSGKYQLHGLPANDFPELPEIDADSQVIYLPVENLLAGLNGTLFASSTDDTKRILTGVHLSFAQQNLEFAATDGHRLAVVETLLDDTEITKSKENLAITIPARTLKELEKILSHYQELAIAVKFDQNQMIFEGTDQKLTSRLIDGSYPNYRQLLPKTFERQVTLERKLFIGALERVAVLADQKNNIVKLAVDPLNQEVSLAVDAPEIATGRESLPAQVSGDQLEIAFNVKYLLDGLKALPSNDISFQMNTATSPAVIIPIGELKMSYLIMPVQIRS